MYNNLNRMENEYKEGQNESSSFIIRNVKTGNEFLSNMYIVYQEKNKYGYKNDYPYRIVLNFGDYPITLKKSKNKDTIQKEFKKIMEKSRLNYL